MRPGDYSTIELHEFPTAPDRYAILSHTWGKRQDEVLFAELLLQADQDLLLDQNIISVDLTSMNGRRLTQRKGWRKLDLALKQASKDAHQWLWIDTAYTLYTSPTLMWC